MFVTLEETDTIVTSFVLEDQTEFALTYDGEQEYWYFIYRQRESEETGAGQWGGWRIAWKGDFKSAQKAYIEMALDMAVEASPYACPPATEEAAEKLIDKIRGTEI